MTLSRSELTEHMAEQMSFIDSSCAGYDAGNHSEAKRLATHVRILVHDTKMSTSLLAHLGAKESMRFYDAVPHEIYEARTRSGWWGPLPGLALIEVGEINVGYVPTFASLGMGKILAPFEAWWNDLRMFDLTGNAVSRKQIVMWLANKDGGAHVDNLPPTYAALTRNGSMGVFFAKGGGQNSATFNIQDGGQVSMDSPIPAAMRHIAEEVRKSIRLHADRSAKAD